jgi:hypothetical protein
MRVIAIGFLALGAWLVPAVAAPAAPGPAWQLSLFVLPTHLAPGTTGFPGAPIYEVVATNVGAGDAPGPVTLSATLPAGIAPIFNAEAPTGGSSDVICSKVHSQTVTCTTAGPVQSSRPATVKIPVEVSGALASGEVLADATASVESPGTTPVSASVPTVIDTKPPPFGFLAGSAGLALHFTEEDGSPTLTAGVHPNQLTIDLGFPVDQPGGSGLTTGAGHPRDIVTDLPPGVVINPRATEVRCTEVELLSVKFGGDPGCPAASQIGMVTVVTDAPVPQPVISALYNMAPTPGTAAEVAFNAANSGVFIHLSGGVRSDSDYGLYAESNDSLARGATPIEHVQAQLWGQPTSYTHDQIRDKCRGIASISCPVPRLETPLITMPSACSDTLAAAAQTRSWEESEEGIEGLPHHTSAEATTVTGTPTAVSGCSLLDFEPSLTVQPNTNTAESPTGVDIELKIPQSEGTKSATSSVRDVTVSFPKGLAINPAAADGLEACSPAQIGMLTSVGETPPHFSRARPQCPEASKIGTVELSTPLLDHPLPGALYVAQPYRNPFGTLLGAYVVIDSPDDGIVAKLAGRTIADPDTGQLTVTFTENPQLPVSSFKVKLFGGPRAAFRTPSTCGTYTTTSVQAPWSGNPPAHTENSFQVTRGANGRPCVATEAQMPNQPGFDAGTATPLAATYSPFFMRLTRNDGEQQMKALDLTLPPGVTGKLAGVATCTDAAIAAAKSKSGATELASPSCSAGSEIGKVEAGAGAGPYPYYTTGKIYLAGPFRKAPLSAVAITPAVAGPFDLGTVVVREPLYVDPVTAIVSVKGGDEFPHILEGVPLELRDARIFLDRNQFTLNPTSCRERAITGSTTSLLGGVAPLFERFQIGGCRGLDYAPDLFIRLKGGTHRGAHPALRAVLEAKPGEEANTAKASVALPRSEFIENAHFQTICTRVQFAAGQCPSGSIYGHVTATTPLLDEPLEGPVYLRSSNNKLPDVVAALQGPPSKPIKVELAGRIDSVNGGLRTTFDFVPDQPVSKVIFSLQGGRKGLFVNSRNLCDHTYRATAKFDGQNGKTHDFQPKLKVNCSKGNQRRARSRHRVPDLPSSNHPPVHRANTE